MGAARVRCLAQGHLGTQLELATSQPTLPRELPPPRRMGHSSDMMNTVLVKLVRGGSGHYIQQRDGVHTSGNGSAERTKNMKEVKNIFVLEGRNYAL